MPLILPRANPLAYPAGVAPGFDSTHVAAQSARFSVPNFVSGMVLLNFCGPTGTKTKFGTVPAVLDSGIGPTAQFTGAGVHTRLTIAGQPAVVDTNQTIAAIIVPQSFAGNGGGIVSTTSATQGACLEITSTGALKWGWLGSSSVTSTIVLSLNVPYFVAASVSAANNVNFIAVNLFTGAVQTQATTIGAGAASTPNGTYTLGMQPGGNIDYAGLTAACMVNTSFMPMAALRQWAADPWSFWYPRRQTNLVGASAVINNAVLNITEGDDALAATAALLIQSALSATQAGDGLSAAAQVLVSALLSGGETSDTVAAAVAIAIQATAAILEDDDAIAATCNTLGVSAINAFLSAIEQDDRIFASVHRNSYIPNPTERGHYISRHAPKPWLGGLGEGPTK